MKKFDIVKLVNEVPYLIYNLRKDMHGVVIEEYIDGVNVLFFNSQNIGDYAVVKVNKQDIIRDEESLPSNIKNELLLKLDNILLQAKTFFKPTTIKEYAIVELLVEDIKYTKYGIHKGDRGCVMDGKAVKNYVLVDFSGIDNKGKYYGDCISVKIDDLKVIN